MGSDPYWAAAPGGAFPSSQLGCTSCHDPHGNANFRFLHGVGPVQNGLAQFIYPAPLAEGISLDPLAGPESNSNHTACRQGMNEWCANCHGTYHDGAYATDFEHDFGRHLGGEVRRQYNRHNGTDDPMGGSYETAYLADVPFESPETEVHSTYGPSTGYAVCLCQICHRAHASSAPRAGRWDFNVTLLCEDGVESGSYPIPDPYDSPNQESLCNKCHDVP